MKINFLVLLLATLVPLVVGFVWYNPRFGFGKAWMQASGVTEESSRGGNMALIFGLTTLFSFFIAFIIQSFVIHQFPVFGLLSQQPDFKTPGSESSELWNNIYTLYGNSFRTFKHGAFHGALMGIFLALPILATNALFERKSFRYIAINAGYWIVSMSLMGGVICAFS